jgi:hypothetical protein
MKINFNDVITEQDGIDIFQVFLSHVDQPDLIKQEIKNAYEVYRQGNYSNGMTKFYQLLLDNQNNAVRNDLTKVHMLAFDALCK